MRFTSDFNTDEKQRSILKTPAKHEISEGLIKLTDIKIRLHQWWESLPSDVLQNEASIESSVSRAYMHLKLEYCLVRMFAGRPFIFPRDFTKSFNSVSTSPADSAPRPSSSTSGRTNPRSVLVADCVEAALTIIDTCQLLRSSIGLARASYTEFSACRAALLVIITQCLQKRTDRLRSSLRYGMTMIKEMAAGGESARSEASLIEAFERAIARLDAAEEAATGGVPEDEYARFKKWEQLWKSDASGQELGSQSSISAAMPLPPQPAMSWQPPLNISQAAAPVQSNLFFSGVEDTSACPQLVDEFTSLFGYGFGSGYTNIGGDGTGHQW